ncbi:hypothetical protein [Selenomonas sp. KH1T6]
MCEVGRRVIRGGFSFALAGNIIRKGAKVRHQWYTENIVCVKFT